MKLFHYSKEPLEQIVSKHQYTNQREKHGWLKPYGLWVSVGIEWSRWCKMEHFMLDHLRYCYQIFLKPDHNVLCLKTYTDIVDFNKKWRDPSRSYFTGNLGSIINWGLLSGSYDGLIISPYDYRARFDFLWYYGWDCASGCIWNKKSIEKFELIKTKRKTRQVVQV